MFHYSLLLLDRRILAILLSECAAGYYHQDQVDSVKLVTDENGTTVTRFEYLPYGETWIQENGTGEEGKHSPKYNSQELDKETNFYFYNARHYDPEIGRFVTADTVIDGEASAAGWNRYMYVHGNPIQYKDPTGHRSSHINTPINSSSLMKGLSSIGKGISSAANNTINSVNSFAKEAVKGAMKEGLRIANKGVRVAAKGLSVYNSGKRLISSAIERGINIDMQHREALVAGGNITTGYQSLGNEIQGNVVTNVRLSINKKGISLTRNTAAFLSFTSETGTYDLRQQGMLGNAQYGGGIVSFAGIEVGFGTFQGKSSKHALKRYIKNMGGEGLEANFDNPTKSPPIGVSYSRTKEDEVTGDYSQNVGANVGFGKNYSIGKTYTDIIKPHYFKEEKYHLLKR